jgi:hypothetical protein
MLLPECAASMTGVPVPSIRICACAAADGVTLDTWASNTGAECDDATMNIEAMRAGVRGWEKRAKDQRFMWAREWGRQTYPELNGNARSVAP